MQKLITKLQKAYSSNDAVTLREKMQELQNSIYDLERIEPQSGHEMGDKKKLLEAYTKEMNKIRNSMQSLQEAPLQAEDKIQAVAYEDEMIIEKAKELKAIQGYIVDINHMLKDCAETVLEQGKDLDTVENFVEISSLSTKDAVVELEKASGYQRKGNKCCIYTSVIIGLMALVFIYIFWPKSNDDNN